MQEGPQLVYDVGTSTSIEDYVRGVPILDTPPEAADTGHYQSNIDNTYSMSTLIFLLLMLCLCYVGVGAVSPGTTAAVCDLLELGHSNDHNTGHGSRRAAAAENLVPYRAQVEQAYNKRTNVQRFDVGQLVGLGANPKAPP